MTRIIIRKIIFDRWNIGHIKRHKVVPEEAIDASKNLLYHRVTYKKRYLAIGRSGKRLITLILKREKAGTYYLITARDTSKKERKRVYEKEKK